MESLKVVIISIVQGITELLPISSSGHILLLGRLFNIEETSSSLIFFHLGTTIAILLFFRKELFSNFFTKKKIIFYLKILVATIPAGITGILLDDIISEKMRATWIIAISLILWGIVMIVLERKEAEKKKKPKMKIEEITWKQSLFIGLGQGIALIPGTSRSGISTIFGILCGLDKYLALEFSFILGIPVFLGSLFWSILKNINDNNIIAEIDTNSLLLHISVIVITFVVGYITLNYIKKEKKNWLTIFGIYRILLGILILLLLAF